MKQVKLSVKKYDSIIGKSLALLKDNRFAGFVVGEIRDKEGRYRNFVALTKLTFQKYKAYLYNDIVLLNVIGSASMRSENCFIASRKLAKIHQNVLIFYKGDTSKIREIFK